MPHDIYLNAQDTRYSSSYLPLIEKIKQHFPKFKNQFYDPDSLEEVFDDNFGIKKYTKQEIIQKGLGIKLEAEFSEESPEKQNLSHQNPINLPSLKRKKDAREGAEEAEAKQKKTEIIFQVCSEDWIEIGFWDNGRINLEVPNYPHREINVMMADILSIIYFLEQEGFAVEHPTEDEIIPKD
jgi:hypothetical protein